MWTWPSVGGGGLSRGLCRRKAGTGCLGLQGRCGLRAGDPEVRAGGHLQVALVFMFASLPTAQVMKLDPWCELKTMPERTAPLVGTCLNSPGRGAAHPQGAAEGALGLRAGKGVFPPPATAPVLPWASPAVEAELEGPAEPVLAMWQIMGLSHCRGMNCHSQRDSAAGVTPDSELQGCFAHSLAHLCLDRTRRWASAGGSYRAYPEHQTESSLVAGPRERAGVQLKYT
ncbi:Hypothetical predicted protein [Marmota monax]|uniref:Uncharacterized protein n=1 Tax=Marmota monax TaxID=9995 RepID=A0A5E4A3P3_MARMO|nr:Hypothetical predicted protein [Marmota monax]